MRHFISTIFVMDSFQAFLRQYGTGLPPAASLFLDGRRIIHRLPIPNTLRFLPFTQQRHGCAGIVSNLLFAFLFRSFVLYGRGFLTLYSIMMTDITRRVTIQENLTE